MDTYDKTQQFMFFVGIYRGNNTLNNIETQNELKRFISVMNNVNLEFFYFTKQNLSMVLMWNNLAEHAYKNSYDYYVNICDNNTFKTVGWVQTSLLRLKQNNNTGYVTFIDPTDQKYDTVIVHQKHFQVFNYFFHEELVYDFWLIWLSKIYPKKYCIYLNNFHILKKQNYNKTVDYKYMDIVVKRDITKLKKHFSYIFQG
tara:strand:- start:214 stop:813 length:600 start_codon:yes stop_codon:yes gene_type:complete